MSDEKWEYMTINADSNHVQSQFTELLIRLNSQGKDGWELVSAVPYGLYGATIFYLKRRAAA